MTTLLLAAAIAITPHQQEVHREGTEWTNVWIPNAQKSDLPRVLLVGDSITQAYYGGVANSLRGAAYVARITSSRSICDPLYLNELDVLIDQYKFELVHFNNGLHGFGYSEDEYTASLKQVVKHLTDVFRPEQLVWAESTPLLKSPKNADLNRRITVRNQAAEKLMQSNGIRINRLGRLMSVHDNLHTDTYHWRREAIKLQADQTAAILRRLLESS
jgi:hypothetical protein